MPSILDQIVAQKKLEIQELYHQFDLETLRRETQPSGKHFYQALAEARTQRQPFFIAEFKRKSPSEGWINQDADPAEQVRHYARAGAAAVSVLTDTPFFGGAYADLRRAAQALEGQPTLLLQKDFVLDPIQVYLARQNGADMVLLISAILSPARLQELRQTAESLGMGVLVEVHDQAELDRIQHLDFPVLGINSRDLNTFRTALNRVNRLARQAGARFVIAESGIHDYRDVQMLHRADGFLIGTGLMRRLPEADVSLSTHFRVQSKPLLFKACGIRSTALLRDSPADYLGINFSPVSRRRADPGWLSTVAVPPNAVAVFYQNTEQEIRDTLARFPFRVVQVYAGDVSADFVRSLRQKVFLACRVRSQAHLDALEAYADDVDLFILDGAVPGSGQPIAYPIPVDFPYPFLLAGGLDATNLDALRAFEQCLGVDIASGLEQDGMPDAGKIQAIAQCLSALSALRV